MMTPAHTFFFGILGLFGLPGHWEVIIIILAVLLLFGARKLPEMARGLARGLRMFRDELKGVRTDLHEMKTDSEGPSEKTEEPSSPSEAQGPAKDPEEDKPQ